MFFVFVFVFVFVRKIKSLKNCFLLIIYGKQKLNLKSLIQNDNSHLVIIFATLLYNLLSGNYTLILLLCSSREGWNNFNLVDIEEFPAKREANVSKLIILPFPEDEQSDRMLEDNQNQSKYSNKFSEKSRGRHKDLKKICCR